MCDGSVDDVDRGVLPVTGARGSDHRAKCLCDAPALADNPTHICRVDMQGELETVSPGTRVDDHGIWIVNDLARDVLEDLLGGSPDGAIRVLLWVVDLVDHHVEFVIELVIEFDVDVIFNRR